MTGLSHTLAPYTVAAMFAFVFWQGWYWRGRHTRRRHERRFGGFIRPRLGASSLANRVAMYTTDEMPAAAANGSSSGQRGLRSAATATLLEHRSVSRTTAPGSSGNAMAGARGRATTAAEQRWLALASAAEKIDRPRLLDLFCGAGGASMGYHRAGFEVVGVDIAPQPHYPFPFIQANALTYLDSLARFGPYTFDGQRFDAIHASPPCQAFTAYRRTGNVGEYPDLIAPVRELLEATGLPWVMENVEGAPLVNPLMLCGSMFDLDVQRHRYFESNVSLEHPVWPCRHRIWAPDRFPGGRSVERTGTSTGLVRACVEVGSWDIPLSVQQAAMGMDWSNLEELSEAIPPVYTEFIGRQLFD